MISSLNDPNCTIYSHKKGKKGAKTLDTILDLSYNIISFFDMGDSPSTAVAPYCDKEHRLCGQSESEKAKAAVEENVRTVFKNCRRVQKNKNKVDIVWVTSRKLDMTIPGGLKLVGYIAWPTDEKPAADQLPWAEFFSPGRMARDSRQNFQVFAALIGCAAEAAAKAETEEEEDIRYEPLDFLSPAVVRGDQLEPPVEARRVFAHAFRESEAAQAAYDAGYRAERRGDT